MFVDNTGMLDWMAAQVVAKGKGDMTQGVKTPIDPGLVARVSAGIRYAITGKAPEWFGPGEPMAPVVPASDKPSVEGRQWDFPAFVNTTPTVRQGRGDYVRAVARTERNLRRSADRDRDPQGSARKAGMDDQTAQRRQGSDSRCDAIANALRLPDQEHTWAQWLRMVLEDLFMLDAPALYVRRTVGGTLYAIEPIDGATIKRVLDDHGRTPMPPATAYQQVLKGMPAVDYTRDELIYLPRNPRTHKIYGYSPVEQIVMTVNIALRRALHQLQFYTEGNIPESLIGVPETWNPDQIQQFQEYWDARCWRATQRPGVMPSSFRLAEDSGDEAGALKTILTNGWLASCASLSRFRRRRSSRRRTGQRQKARRSRRYPKVLRPDGMGQGADGSHHRQSTSTRRILNFSGIRDRRSIRWCAQIHQIYVQAKIKTADEVRAELGADPLTAEQRAELTPQPPPMPPAANQQPPEPTCKGGSGKGKKACFAY